MKIYILSITAIAMAILIYSCSKKNNPTPSPTPNHKITVTAFTPTTGNVHTVVTITGSGFGADTNAVGIKFGSSSTIRPMTITDVQITVAVPTDATTGKISINSSDGMSATSTDQFTVTATAPAVAISDFSPKTGGIATSVTITGTGFGTDINSVTVKFGGSAAVKPTTVSASQLTVAVPSDAATGKITVTVTGNSPVASTADFTVTPPPLSITDFSPKTFTEQDTIVITGTNFGSSVNNVSVYLESSLAIKPLTVTPTKITAIIPYDPNIGFPLTDKLQVVVTSTGAVKSTQSFTYLPIVASDNITPTTARPGYLVKMHFTINHIAWGAQLANLSATTVTFNGSTAMNPLTASNGYVTARVPANAKTGTIKVGYTGYATGTSSFSLTILPKLAAPQSGQWDQRPDFPGASGESGAVAFTIAGKAYVGCGAENGSFGGPQRDMWQYDPQYDAWMQVADYGGGARRNAVAFTIGNNGYIGTGIDENGSFTSDFWEYDPAANTWTQKASFKGGTRSDAVGFGIGGKGYIGSGYNGSNNLNDFYAYDPTTNTWTATASIPGVRNDAFAFVIGSQAYVGDGNNYPALISDLYMYDPATDTWTAKAATPAYNYGSGNASFSISGKGYIGLGYKVQNGFQVGSDQIFEYTPTTNSWKAMPNFGGTSRSGAVGFAINDVGYFGMGQPANGATGNYLDVWSYKN